MKLLRRVFSAHAEVVPFFPIHQPDSAGILRARGGSSQKKKLEALNKAVFSAHAEVVPPPTVTVPIFWSILRARGGSSPIIFINLSSSKYSPRTRR